MEARPLRTPIAPVFVDGPDGLAIATWDMGGEGPDLLIVHATGFHSLAYWGLADELTHRYHVTGVDLRGHGLTAAPPLSRAADGGFPMLAWERLGTDVLAVIDALGLDHPVGFGHSCGGTTLMLAEAERPGTFSAIHAFEPVAFNLEARPADTKRGLAAGALRRRARFVSLDAAFDNYRSKPPLSVLRPDILWDYVEGGFATDDDGAAVLRCAPEVESATFEMAQRSTIWDRLGDVHCPVRVTCGGPTGQFRLPIAEAVASRLADGSAHELPHLSHFGPFEHPEDIAVTIKG